MDQIRLTWLAVVGVVLTTAAGGAAAAGKTELVANGEFESPACPPGGFGFCGTESIGSSWTTTTPAGFELWAEGALFGLPEPPSPTIGADGHPTGQHLEVNPDTVTHTFAVPSSLVDPSATFSFDAWLRIAGSGTYEVTGSSSGTLVETTVMSLSTTAWTAHVHSLSVLPGETILITFIGIGTAGENPHIDQVSFTVDVPEPMPTLSFWSATLLPLLLVLGGLRLAASGRRLA